LGNNEKSRLVAETPSVTYETSYSREKLVSGSPSTSNPIGMVMVDSAKEKKMNDE